MIDIKEVIQLIDYLREEYKDNLEITQAVEEEIERKFYYIGERLMSMEYSIKQIEKALSDNKEELEEQLELPL